MLTCITCSKQRAYDSRENAKDGIKSLTNQVKDMALKVSGANKGNPNTKGRIEKGQRSYPSFDPVSRGGLETISEQSSEVLVENEGEPGEWSAQIEPGVQITLATMPGGGNDLKRIRFSREMFNKWEAQRWWGENYNRVMELYNVQRFNQQALNSTPGGSEDGARDSGLGSTPRMVSKEWYKSPSMDASRATNSSVSNVSDIESEWIEEDEPGVYITIRQLVDGTRELRRVRFSREKFGEVHAKLWWETNRGRIQTQYHC